MTTYTERKGLSVEQIAWAKSHDWFVSEGWDPEGGFCVNVETTCIDHDGSRFLETAIFYNMSELRAWAGY